MQPCKECRFDPNALSFEQLPATFLRLSGAIAEHLSNGGDRVFVRPVATVWSPLEYACHVRDVFLIQRDRLYLALVEDRPRFARMYGDDRAVLDGYNSQSPSEVGGELAVASRLLAGCVARLSPSARARRLIYNFPSPAEHSIEWLARYSAHEGAHHLFDIERILSSSGSSRD